VAPGDCSPGAPTDPDVRHYRIRFLRQHLRFAVGASAACRRGQASTETGPAILSWGWAETDGVPGLGCQGSRRFALRMRVLVGGEAALGGIGEREAQAVRDQVGLR
jgi:hypothetical protein